MRESDVAFRLAGLTSLMERTSGTSNLTIALIDGPVATGHPDLARERLREVLCLASIRTSVLIDHANAESGIGTVVLSSRVAQTKTRNWRSCRRDVQADGLTQPRWHMSIAD